MNLMKRNSVCRFLLNVPLNTGQDRTKTSAGEGQAGQQAGSSKPPSRGEEGGRGGEEEPRGSADRGAGSSDPGNRARAILLLLVLVPLNAHLNSYSNDPSCLGEVENLLARATL